MGTEANKVVAVVGMCGAGKSITSDFFRDTLGYQFLRFGQITLDEVQRRGLEPTEQIEKSIREGLRREHGMAAFAILNEPKIRSLLESGNVVADGLYSWSELKYLREQFVDNLTVVAIHSPPALRYKRLEERTQVDAQMRNRPMTSEQARSRDYAEIENIEKAGPIAMADIMIVNTGEVTELLGDLNYHFGDKFRRDSWDDYFMKIAALVAERSNCRRHHIGAITVKDKRILTTGYNGGAKDMPDCLELGCRKDELGHSSGVGHNDCRAIHAEQNAIIQAASKGINIDGATIYSTHTPCSICANMIKNVGIRRVVSYHDYADASARAFLEKAGVQLDKLDRPYSRISFKD